MSGEETEQEIANLRREYTQGGLHRSDLDPNPFAQFRKWFDQARSAKLLEPNAMTLATSDSAGFVTARTVLLKAYDERGFVFFTNYKSLKAQQIGQNPKVALLFTWLPLERQVSICGTAEKISTVDSVSYFLSRPFGSRIGAWVSEQSKVISSRSLLEAKFEEMLRKFADGNVPLPDFWGGYRVKPQRVEFWQGGQGRLHDRFCYLPQTENEWLIERLSP